MQPLPVMQLCSQITKLQFILGASIHVGKKGNCCVTALKSIAALELK